MHLLKKVGWDLEFASCPCRNSPRAILRFTTHGHTGGTQVPENLQRFIIDADMAGC